MITRPLLEAISLPLFTTLVLAASACASAPTDSQRSSSSGLEAAPVLGSAQSFAVLAGATVTNTGSSTIRGDLGVSPGLAITGFPPGLVTGGTLHAGDAVALQAQTDATTAYDTLGAEACGVDLSGQDLGGLTLAPGVYCFSSSAQLTGALVLDAAGRADAVFVFKIGSTLTTASNASVRVINGGNDCGVFWQVGSSATLGTGTELVGSVIALASITLTTDAKLSGRALARTGAVTLDSNAVSLPICSVAPSSDGGATDTGPTDDAGAAPDAALPPIDAALPPVDAALPPVDAALPPVDAALPPLDAGHDASTRDADAGSDGAVCCSETTCGGACVDLYTDSQNCGACGTVCASTDSCVLGVCTVTCPSK